MNKKLLVVSILAVFMLVAISYASAVSYNITSDEQRESPLFRIRARQAIGERLSELKENIKATFIGERVFFLPSLWLRNRIHEYRLATETPRCTYDSTVTCKNYYTCYVPKC